MSSRLARLWAFLSLRVVVPNIKIQRIGTEILDHGLKGPPTSDLER